LTTSIKGNLVAHTTWGWRYQHRQNFREAAPTSSWSVTPSTDRQHHHPDISPLKLEPQCHTTWPSATQAAQDKLPVDHKATPPKSGAAAPTYSQICWDKPTNKYWHTCLQETMSHFIDILTYECYITKHC
jgi:hypothetical protein